MRVGNSRASPAADVLIEALRSECDRYALFLDVDGTLLDIAPTPDSVCVPEGLPALLVGLSKYLHGALAIVSGRATADLDQLLRPARLSTAGVHGAQFRLLDAASHQQVREGDEPALHPNLRAALVALGAQAPGVLIEDKGASVAVHYRGVPQRQQPLREQIDLLITEHQASTGETSELIAGKMIYEVKGAGYNKGTAVQRFLQSAPFSGRRPIMIGDDATDEFAFAFVAQAGGLALSVGPLRPGASATFNDPCDVRCTLAQVLAPAHTRAPR